MSMEFIERVKIILEWIGITGGTVVSASVVWNFLFKKGFTWIFDRSLHRNIEEHKHELSSHLEKYKHDLNTEKDLIKHELNKEMLNIEFFSKEKHTVYHHLFEKIVRAFNSTTKLSGFKTITDWTQYSEGDVRDLFSKYKVTEKQLNELISEFNSNPPVSGVQQINHPTCQKLNDLLQVIEFKYAKDHYSDAGTYYELKKLFINPAVQSKVDEILKLTWSLWVAQDADYNRKKGTTKTIETTQHCIKTIPGLIRLLEEEMRRELSNK